MSSKNILCFGVLFLFAALPLADAQTRISSAQPGNVSSIAEQVDRHYNRLQSLKAEFTELYRGAGIERAESGTLFLKKPGKMRWDYASPQKKIFVSDGKTAYFYVPGERQARRAEVSQLDDLRSPLGYLLGKTKLAKEFDHLTISSNEKPYFTGDVVLRGVPQAMQDRVNQVLLEISPNYAILRIVIDEADGSTTEFRFTNLAENVGLPDSLFRFVPPADVEVIDSPDLTP